MYHFKGTLSVTITEIVGKGANKSLLYLGKCVHFWRHDKCNVKECKYQLWEVSKLQLLSRTVLVWRTSHDFECARPALSWEVFPLVSSWISNGKSFVMLVLMSRDDRDDDTSVTWTSSTARVLNLSSHVSNSTSSVNYSRSCLFCGAIKWSRASRIVAATNVQIQTSLSVPSPTIFRNLANVTATGALIKSSPTSNNRDDTLTPVNVAGAICGHIHPAT